MRYTRYIRENLKDQFNEDLQRAIKYMETDSFTELETACRHISDFIQRNPELFDIKEGFDLSHELDKL